MVNDQTNPKSKTFTVREGPSHRQVCTTTDIEYVPDSMKHVYGKSTRPALEDWFLTELDFFRNKYPGYEIFTLGSSLVFGERFITYLTICEFTIETEQDFYNLKHALHESDQAIRRKWAVLWKWDIGAMKGKEITFMVGHMDFAYFLHHREEFRDAAHGRYMRAFIGEDKAIRSQDYKVLHDGTIVPFDETLLSPEDRNVFENYDRIKFETVALKAE